MIIAIDFDGTCVTHDYPEIGKDIGAVAVLKRLSEAGHQLILHTMRSDEPLTHAVKWFERNGIELFGVNNNPQQHTWTSSPKTYAHLYIDDAALGAPLMHGWHSRPYVDWKACEAMLIKMGMLQE